MKRFLAILMCALLLAGLVPASAFAETGDGAGIPVASVSLRLPEDVTALAAGDTVLLEAEVLPEDAANRALIWESGDETVATVDENGLVAALAPGLVTITALAADGSGQQGEIELTVQPAKTAAPEGNTPAPVPEETPATEPADPAETATPATEPADPAETETPATEPTDPAETATPTPELTDPAETPTPEATPILVASITVTAAEDALWLPVGGALQMLATVLPGDAADQTVAWSVLAGTGNAEIDEAGLLTGLAAGTVTVVATANDGGGVSGSLPMEVTLAAEGAAALPFLGEGTADAPYQIGNAEQLAAFSALVNLGDARCTSVHAVLTAPIDLGGATWTPIGNAAFPFAGAFDGQGHALSGLSGGGDGAYFGLFGETNGALLQNIVLLDVSISLSGAYTGVGAIVGRMQAGSLCRCYVAGSIETEIPGATGGLVGVLAGGLIEDCFNAARIAAKETAGGVAGSAAGDAVLRACYGAGTVTAKNAFGRVVGRADGASAESCYAVDGTDPLAEFVSWADAAQQGSYAGFDFSGVWRMGDGFYAFPVLLTSPFAGDSGWVRDENSYPLSYRGIERDAPRSTQRRRARDAYATVYTTPNLPAVRDQNPYGTCYAHSVIAAAEIDRIRDGAASTSVNYAELQLAWFHHKGPKKADGTFNDPLNNFGGDYNLYNGDVWDGDNSYFLSRTVASWMGVISEDTTTAYSNATTIRSNGLPYAYAFSKDAAHLTDVRIIPLDCGTDVIKQAILDYGAVTISYLHTNSCFTNNECYYYNASYNSTNHAVTLIGWDDSISASYFCDTSSGTEQRPTGNGAWLVRNSWGAYWGLSGNFYMSYESAAVSTANYEGFVWDYSSASNYERCYQYDGTSSMGATYIYSTTPAAANVFTAQQDERVEAVSFWMDDQADVDYTVNVYTDLTDPANPVSGTLAATASGRTSYAGYYTVPLTTPVNVASDASFSVAITFQNPTGADFWLPLDKSSTQISWIYFYAISAAGQSFVSRDGVYWTDIGANNGGNCRIKAFTSAGRLAESVTVDSPADYIAMGGTLPMSAAVLPDETADKTVAWRVINRTGEAGIDAAGLLTPVAPGTVTVVATANDGSGAVGTKMITITAAGAPLILTVDTSSLAQTPDEIWIDGVQYGGDELTVSGSNISVPLGTTGAMTAVVYTYNDPQASSDPHTVYPTGMAVWRLTFANGAYTATRLTELDDLLRYSGSSIRITGNKGIRMITSLSTELRTRLIDGGVEGYTLLEYGTVAAWTSAMAGQPLLLGRSYANPAYAYKKGVVDPIYKITPTGLTQYTNVLIFSTMDKCVPDLALRPYIILEDANGAQLTLYGGVIIRNIGYIAYQNRNAFQPGNAAYDYIWSIIHYVYGNAYDADYRG